MPRAVKSGPRTLVLVGRDTAVCINTWEAAAALLAPGLYQEARRESAAWR